MEEYLRLGQMRKVDEYSEGHNKICYYLLHHPVVKDDEMYDASRKTSTGTSSNDMSLPGPVIQGDLRLIILRRRNKANQLRTSRRCSGKL